MLASAQQPCGATQQGPDRGAAPATVTQSLTEHLTSSLPLFPQGRGIDLFE